MKRQQFACGWTAGCLLAGLGVSLPAQADTVLYSNHYTQPSDVPAGFYGDVARASVPDGGLTASLLASSVGLLGFFCRLGRGVTQGKE